MDWNQFMQPESESEFEASDQEENLEVMAGELPRRRRPTAGRPTIRRKAPPRFPFQTRRPALRFPVFPSGGFTVIRDRYGNEPSVRPDKPAAEPGSSGSSSSSGGYAPDNGAPPVEGNEHMRWLQNTLNKVLNLQLAVDGIMKPAVRNAIRSFQEQKGLPVDGILGPETERALIEASRAQPSTDGGATDQEFANYEWEGEVNRTNSEYIKWIQRSLNQILGLRLAVDGISGVRTRSAIRQFQRKKNLSESGNMDSPTEAALTAAGAGSPPSSTPTSSFSPWSWITNVWGGSVKSTASMPPVEGPYQGVTGTQCANGSGKCWKSAVRDIIDSDAPWNGASNRSAANYIAVLNYLNVDNPGNYRFAPRVNSDGKLSTYCNIYGHDATRMMSASIPHWIRDISKPKGWNEMGANRTFDWMRSNSRSIGWVHVDASLCQWVKEQFDRKQSIPYSDRSVPEQILTAGSKIAALNHSNPSLLLQPSYVAQQFANLGLPAVMLWKNPKLGANGRPRSGHVALVRPEDANYRGQLDRRTGIYVPQSAQAGRKNYRNALATWITGSTQRSHPVLFYVHA